MGYDDEDIKDYTAKMRRDRLDTMVGRMLCGMYNSTDPWSVSKPTLALIIKDANFVLDEIDRAVTEEARECLRTTTHEGNE